MPGKPKSRAVYQLADESACQHKSCINDRARKARIQKRQQLAGTFQSMDTRKAADSMAEAGIDYGRHVRAVRRIVMADASLVRQLSLSGRQTLEEVEEGLFRVHRTHSTIATRTHELMYRLQDMLLVEECNRLRRQMNKIASLPPDKKTDRIREREQQLISRIVRIVNKRDAMLADLHIEQMRGTDEQEQIDEEHSRWRREWMRMFNTPVLKDSNHKGSVFRSVGKKLLNRRKAGKG